MSRYRPQPSFFPVVALCLSAILGITTCVQSGYAQDENDPFGEIIEETPGNQESSDPFGEPIEEQDSPPQQNDPFGEPIEDDEPQTITEEDTEPEAIPPEASRPKQSTDNPLTTDPNQIDDPFGEPTQPSNMRRDTNLDSKKKDVLPGDSGTGIGSQFQKNEFPSLRNPINNTNPNVNSNIGAAKTESEPARKPSGPTEKQKAFAKKFWRYLIANNYKNWGPVPGTADEFRPSMGPHGALQKMYLNRTAAGNFATLPHGSVIVAESYGTDRSLQEISVMYRAKDFNAAGKDWYWIKFNPDGSVAQGNDPKSPIGKAQSCMDCHSSAKGGDYSFMNDGN